MIDNRDPERHREETEKRGISMGVSLKEKIKRKTSADK